MRLLPDPVSLGGSGNGSSDSKETRGEDDDSDDMVCVDGLFGSRCGSVSQVQSGGSRHAGKGLCLSLKFKAINCQRVKEKEFPLNTVSAIPSNQATI